MAAMTAHQLARSDYGFACAICGQQWRNQPASRCPGLRVYSWGAVPEHLKTQTRLKQMGLKLADGQQPAGLLPSSQALDGYWRLYDVNQAVPRPKASAARTAALAKAREAQRQYRTCKRCGFVDTQRLPEGLCVSGLRDEVLAKDRADAIAWARELLAAPGDWVILDLEATGLGAEDEIIQIGVLAPSGEVLLDTLIRPSKPMPRDGTAIHKITDAMVAGDPTFSEVYPALVGVTQGKSIVTYNASADRAMLQRECKRHNLPKPGAARWMCTMNVYAAYFGDWSDYWGDYRFQKLPGGDHTAIGDCRATLKLMHDMAATNEQGPCVVPGMSEEAWPAWLNKQKETASK
ncbi:MAG: 3'-5' exonuclease [Ardenticatenaceae bacterium]|nr:3'-5' exonuclease [Ardenticatenaceae bacterium]